jgi:uncharacterized metal-binding protein YceD (DUF177 family)
MPIEFSRRLPWAAVTPQGRTETLVATPQEAAALAARFGIPAIESLTARLTLREGAGGAAEAEGVLAARVVQTCVVTLTPVTQTVSEPLSLRFLPEGQDPADEDPDGPDEIPTEGGMIELGEAVAESLSLALDPFPRHPDAAVPPEYAAPAEEAAEEQAAPAEAVPARPHPFAALASLKKH